MVLEFNISEWHYKGDRLGACSKCEAESAVDASECEDI